MAKLDKDARDELETAIETLEELGWDVTELSVDGDPGVMHVDVSMHNRATNQHRIRNASGGFDR